VPADEYDASLSSLVKRHSDHLEFVNKRVPYCLSYTDVLEHGHGGEQKSRGKAFMVLPEPKLLLLLANQRLMAQGDHATALLAASRVVYTAGHHRLAVESLLGAYGTASGRGSQPRWERVHGWKQQLQALQDAQEAVCCVFLAPASHPMWKELSQASAVPLQYDDVDVHRVRVLLPSVSQKALDVKRLLPKSSPKPRVLTLLAVDALIVCRATAPRFAEAYGYVYADLEPMLPAVSYHSKRIDFWQETLDRAAQHSERVRAAVDTRRGVLEQFKSQEHPVLLEVNEPLDGFVTQRGEQQLMQLESESVSGVRLRDGDRLFLNAESPAEHNGAWTVRAGLAADGSIALTRPAPAASRSSANDDDVKGRCIGRTELRTRQDCAAVRGVWDAPCEAHDDCPFFQKNNNYRNYRGGCRNGFCELPVGLKRVGYRTFELSDASFPFCHACIGGPASSGCCKQQERDRALYPRLNGPDYAFELDQLERRLPTGSTKNLQK
jgi:hypothetical protein